MAITAKYMLCGESVVRDAQSNAVSIFNVLEDITTLGFPALIPRLALVAATERESGDSPKQEAELRIALGDRVILEHKFPIDYQDKFVNRAIMQFQGIVLEGPGLLTMRMSIGGQQVATYQVRIAQARQGQIPFPFTNVPVGENAPAGRD